MNIFSTSVQHQKGGDYCSRSPPKLGVPIEILEEVRDSRSKGENGNRQTLIKPRVIHKWGQVDSLIF